MYQKLSDEEFKTYFVRETSFYLSQGCKFDCEFCAAVKNQEEQYRDESVIYSDLCYVVERLQSLGIFEVSMYLLSLDIFQSPQQLEGFADMILQIIKNNPNFSFSLRGLAGPSSFINLRKHHPEVLEKLVKAGFNNVGYGIDGMGSEVWKGVKKPQNNEKNTLDAIRFSKEKYNITPELLMVFGHVGIDTEKTLKDAFEFVENMIEKYGALPRPHIAKSFLPGNKGWIDQKSQHQIGQIMCSPQLFQSLDFTAFANKITHPDTAFREIVNYYYLKMCELPGNTTQPIIPYEIGDSDEERENKRKRNLNKYDCGGKEIITISH